MCFSNNRGIWWWEQRGGYPMSMGITEEKQIEYINAIYKVH